VKVAFLANTYHLTKTRSSQFFIDLLRAWFGEIAVVPHQDVWARLPGTRWDLIVVWQHQFRPRELEAFGARNVVLVPMYDDCPKDRDYWVRYRGFKVLCFSRTLADSLEDWGLDCLRVTYRPPVPGEPIDFKGGLKGFFWPRTADLDWRHVGPLVASAAWTFFHLHTGHTPAVAALPLAEQFHGADFRRTDWFERPEDYGQALRRTNVFFAPRRYEGIGMAVLEALALGQCVVAPDCPTANEYIASGVDGLLFDPDRPVPIDLSQAERLGRAARQASETGRKNWEKDLPRLQNFLETPPSRPRRGAHPLIVARGRGLAALRWVYRWTKSMRRVRKG
jgi:hypothetical protein